MSKPNDRDHALAYKLFGIIVHQHQIDAIAAYREEIESRLAPKPEPRGDALDALREAVSHLSYDEWPNEIENARHAIASLQGQGDTSQPLSDKWCAYWKDFWLGQRVKAMDAEANPPESPDSSAHPQPAPGLREALAFVHGAKWWEYHSTNGTMWQSDQALVSDEAEKRYGYRVTGDDLVRAALAQYEKEGE